MSAASSYTVIFPRSKFSVFILFKLRNEFQLALKSMKTENLDLGKMTVYEDAALTASC